MEGAFAAILDLIGLDDVVQFRGATDAERGAHYDAAIVTSAFHDEARAEVVIELPDINGTTGGPDWRCLGQVRKGAVSDDVSIRDQRQVISLLDLHVPTAVSRGDRLLEAQRRRAS